MSTTRRVGMCHAVRGHKRDGGGVGRAPAPPTLPTLPVVMLNVGLCVDGGRFPGVMLALGWLTRWLFELRACPSPCHSTPMARAWPWGSFFRAVFRWRFPGRVHAGCGPMSSMRLGTGSSASAFQPGRPGDRCRISGPSCHSLLTHLRSYG